MLVLAVDAFRLVQRCQPSISLIASLVLSTRIIFARLISSKCLSFDIKVAPVFRQVAAWYRSAFALSVKYGAQVSMCFLSGSSIFIFFFSSE